MRDDISALSALRMFPEAEMSHASPTPVRTLNFAAQLARASKQLRHVLNAHMAPRQHTASALKPRIGHIPVPTSHTPTALKPSTTPMPPSIPWNPFTSGSAPWNPFTSGNSGNATPPSESVAPSQSLAPTQSLAPSRSVAPAQGAAPTAPIAPLPPAQTNTASSAMPLSAYPHPVGDNGRGMHWIPTTEQSPATIDRFVGEAQKMGVKWVTFLNNGTDATQNDYLVKKLVSAGIEPIMRIYTPTLQPIDPSALESMVRHFTGMGVHYFQPYNEPNLNAEQPDGKVSVDRYVDNWIPAAQAIERGGGLAGFGSMAPGGDLDDIQFLKQALDRLKQRGQLGLLDKGWLSMHNYTHNHPIDPVAGSDGFFKFNTYHQILSNALGRDLPIIGTEGGTFVGEQEDPTMPVADAGTVAKWATQAYTYMRDQRAPWNFAYSFWTIANDAAGGGDARFNAEALFKGDGSHSQVVSALQALTRG